MSNATTATAAQTVAAEVNASKTVGVSIRSIARDESNDGFIKRGDRYLVDPRRLVIEAGFNIREVRTEKSRQQIDELKRLIAVFIENKLAEKIAAAEAKSVKPGASKPVIPAKTWGEGFLELFEELQVVTTTDGHLKVFGGYHRTTAILELIAEGWNIQYVHINAQQMNDTDTVKAMLRSDHGLRFTALDKARGYTRLADAGVSYQEIADDFGGIGEFKSDAARVELLVLLGRSDDRIHDLIASGRVDAEDAITVVSRFRDEPYKAYLLLAMLRSAKGACKMTPLEKAIGFTRLADECGMSITDIAKTSEELLSESITVQRVEQLVLLGRADERIHPLVASKAVSADAAIEVIRQFRDDTSKAFEELQARVAESGGKRSVGRPASGMTKKVQERFVGAIRSNSKSLQTSLDAFKATHGDDWKTANIAVELPAELIAQLLERHGVESSS